jgi:hypothetical protein
MCLMCSWYRCLSLRLVSPTCDNLRTYVVGEFANSTLFMFLCVIGRFRCGEMVYIVGDLERYSHNCVFK